MILGMKYSLSQLVLLQHWEEYMNKQMMESFQLRDLADHPLLESDRARSIRYKKRLKTPHFCMRKLLGHGDSISTTPNLKRSETCIMSSTQRNMKTTCSLICENLSSPDMRVTASVTPFNTCKANYDRDYKTIVRTFYKLFPGNCNCTNLSHRLNFNRCSGGTIKVKLINTTS